MNLPGAADILVRVLSVCILSTAALALMLLASRRLSRNAALRHLGWATTFVLILALPLLQSYLPPVFKYRLPLPAKGADDRDSAPARPQSSAGERAAAWFSSAPSTAQGVVLLFGAAWLCGVGVIALRFATAAVQLRWMRRRSIAFPVRASNLLHVRDQVALAHGWHLRMSTIEEPVAPVTWGFFRPVVLMPKDSDRWERARIRAVLLHELAHVERGDNLHQIVALVVCALHWFNPLVWVCARRMRTEAEIAADDLVLCAGVRASSYAGELLQFALQLNGGSQPFALLGASMATPFTLETRITSIIDPDPVRGRLRWRQVLSMQGLCLVTLCSVCFLRPTFADERGSRGRDTSALSQGGADALRSNQLPADVSQPPARPRPTLGSRGEGSRPVLEQRRSPDVLSEQELRELRRLRDARSAGTSPDVWRAAPASARPTGSADSLGHADRVGADRLPP
jgi:beta-lactamase regulating signal transducer with metallopeptidase domain